MEVDNEESIFPQLLPLDQNEDRTLLNIKKNLHCTISGATHIITMDSVVFVNVTREDGCFLVTYKMEEVEKEVTFRKQQTFAMSSGLIGETILQHDSILSRKLFVDLMSSSLIIGSYDGPVFCLNSTTKAPLNHLNLLCDLKQQLAFVIPITLGIVSGVHSKENIFAVNNNQKTKTLTESCDISPDCISFVGKKGKVITACYHLKTSSIQFYSSQFPHDVVCCRNVGNKVILASQQHISLFKAECKLNAFNSGTGMSKRIIDLQFQLMNVYNIPNVNQMLVRETNPTEIICSNTSGKIFRVIFEKKVQSSSSFPLIEQQSSFMTLMENYADVHQQFGQLKKTSLELNRGLMEASVKGALVQMLKTQPTLLTISSNVKILRQGSGKKIFLSIDVTNNTPFAIPSSCLLHMQYHASFDAHFCKRDKRCESFQLKSIQPSNSYNFVIAEDFVTYMPLQCNLFLQVLSPSEVSHAFIHIKRFAVAIVDFCEITNSSAPSSFEPNKSFVSCFGSFNKLSSFSIDFNVDKFNLSCKRTPLDLIFPTSELVGDDGVNKENNIVIEHVLGGRGRIRCTVEENKYVIRVSSKNLIFLASLHHQFYSTFKVTNK